MQVWKKKAYKVTVSTSNLSTILDRLISNDGRCITLQLKLFPPKKRIFHLNYLSLRTKLQINSDD